MARQVLDNGVILPSEYSDDWYDDMTSNLTKLDEVIGSDAEKLDESDVGAAAISNDYDDLDDKPTYNILRRASVTLTAGGTGNYSDLDSDSKIKAGDYVLDAANKLYSITAIDAANSTYTVSAAAIINITDKSELGAAALSNSYDDLNNLPGYGILRFCSTAITDNSSVPFANISSVSKIAAGDFLLDTAGKMYVIASVDTVNETAAVTTPLTQLALDANVVHTSGNETVDGQKTFTNTIKSQKEIELTGNRLAYILPEFSASYSGLSLCTYGTNGAVKIGSWKVDNNDNTKHVLDASLGYLSVSTGSVNSVNIVYLTPKNTTNSKLGDSTNKWREINGLTPSSLGMPDFSNRVDIAGYISNLSGSTNIYTPTVNGWLYVGSNDASYLALFDTGSGGCGIRFSDGVVGEKYACIPCQANRTLGVKITCTNLAHAYFVPCLGNI